MQDNDSIAKQIAARQIGLTLFCSALLNSFLTTLFGFFVKSTLIIHFGGIGVAFGLCSMLMMSWLYNRVCSDGSISPSRSKFYQQLGKVLEYAGYAFVLWGILGIVILVAGVV